MKQRINIAELLQDYPIGMELDCTVFENLTFEKIDEVNSRILCNIQGNNGKIGISFNKFGCYSELDQSKCVIFPKGKTTWEGFVQPCKFKDGDVIVDKYGAVAIYKRVHSSYEEPYVDFHCGITSEYRSFFVKDSDSLQHCGKIDSIRLATEEEKQELFKSIEDNGYKWNAETKTLEKLVEPRFKVGDRIRNNQVDLGNIYTIIEVRESSYVVNKNNEHNNYDIDFVLQDDWELAPNKFDITTLKPFESKVLVRTSNRKWVAAFYSHYDKDASLHYCVVGGLWYEQCIPYDGNEHLLNTTDDCDEFYKNW